MRLVSRSFWKAKFAACLSSEAVRVHICWECSMRPWLGAGRSPQRWCSSVTQRFLLAPEHTGRTLPGFRQGTSHLLCWQLGGVCVEYSLPAKPHSHRRTLGHVVSKESYWLWLSTVESMAAEQAGGERLKLSPSTYIITSHRPVLRPLDRLSAPSSLVSVDPVPISKNCDSTPLPRLASSGQ